MSALFYGTASGENVSRLRQDNKTPHASRIYSVCGEYIRPQIEYFTTPGSDCYALNLWGAPVDSVYSEATLFCTIEIYRSRETEIEWEPQFDNLGKKWQFLIGNSV